MISIPVLSCETMWTKMAHSHSLRLLMLALRCAPCNSPKERMHALIGRILERAPSLDGNIWTSKLVDKIFDWKLFDKYGPRRLSLDSHLLANKVDTLERLKHLINAYPKIYLSCKIKIVKHHPLFFSQDTCFEAWKLLLTTTDQWDVSDIVNSWLKRLLQQPSEVQPFFMEILRAVKKTYPTIDLLAAFSDIDSKFHSAYSAYPDLLPTLKDTYSYKEMEMYKNFLPKVLACFNADALKELASKMSTKELVLFGCCSLGNPPKFKQYIWPELRDRFRVTEAASNYLALKIYMSGDENSPSKYINALECFSDANVLYIIESQFIFPIHFLQSHPQLISALDVRLSNIEGWLNLGCEHLTDQQLAALDWTAHSLSVPIPPEIMARITRKGANILPPKLLEDIEFFNECKNSTITVDVEETEQCAVCIGSFKESHSQGELVQLSCKHIFHVQCCRNWIKSQKSNEDNSTCPLCRTPVCLLFEENLF